MNDDNFLGYDHTGSEVYEGEIIEDLNDFNALDPLAIEIGAHLSNHTPPIPLIMVETCLDAIARASVGLWDDEVELPKGTLWKESDVCPVWVIITSHHLEQWVTPQEDLITITDEDGAVVYKGLGERQTEEEGETNG
jgi:hypothetical protein